MTLTTCDLCAYSHFVIKGNEMRVSKKVRSTPVSHVQPPTTNLSKHSPN